MNAIYTRFRTLPNFEPGSLMDISDLGSLAGASQYVKQAYGPIAPYRQITPTPMPTPHPGNFSLPIPEMDRQLWYFFSLEGPHEIYHLFGLVFDDDIGARLVEQKHQVSGNLSVIYYQNSTLIILDMKFVETGIKGNSYDPVESFVSVQEVNITLDSGRIITSGENAIWIDGTDRPVDIVVSIWGAFENSLFPRLMNKEKRYYFE